MAIKHCAYCDMLHYGKQVYNKQLENYVCEECHEELNKQKEKK